METSLQPATNVSAYWKLGQTNNKIVQVVSLGNQTEWCDRISTDQKAGESCLYISSKAKHHPALPKLQELCTAPAQTSCVDSKQARPGSSRTRNLHQS